MSKNKNNKCITVPIKGMHCRSCEILIEESLKELPQVKSADINCKTGEATVYYHGEQAPIEQVNKAIVAAGYEVGQEGVLPILSRDKKEYVSLGVAFLFLMALYLILKAFGLTDINLNPDLSSPSWGLIILIGLVAGVSTCMALVGGLSLGLSTKYLASHPTATRTEKFRPHIFFVLGRILSYALLGGVLGVIGTVFQFSALANGILLLIIGVVMLIMGLQLINIFPRLSKFKITLPKSVGKVLGLSQKNKEYSHGHAMLMGALTFFLPCGFTQAMQLYAVSTGDFWTGALVMGLFALGTAPGLLSIGGIASLVKGSFKQRFFKVAGLAIIVFALFNLNNGYTLASLNIGNFSSGDSSQTTTPSDPNVSLENGVQVIHMVESGRGYSPNKFSIKKDVPVKVIVDAQAPYSCASVMLIPKLKIQKFLTAGENTIEFTPTEVGSLPFSCSMGMYTGVFNVYDDSQSVSGISAAQAAGNQTSARSAGTCGVTSGGGGGGCGCGGGKKVVVDNSNPVQATLSQSSGSDSNVQVIKTVYTADGSLSPAAFKVKAGTKVRLEIDVRADGSGCGYAMKIPELYEDITPIQAGVPIVIEFTPTTPGTYDITCSMEMIRYGVITVE